MKVWLFLTFVAIVIWYIVQRKGKESRNYSAPDTSKSLDTGNTKAVSFDLSGGIIDIAALDFIGEFSRSPDGRYLLAWRDGDPLSGVGGARDKGHGQYVLIKDSKIITKGRLQRPNDGKIANNGNFVLNDWMFSQELQGTFYAFSPSGEVLIKKKFNANLLNNGLSEDGRFAVCQTHDSGDDRDSDIICIFDLEAKKKITRFRPFFAYANADRLLFDTENRILHLIFNDKPSHRYSFDGSFLDKERWEEEKIEHMSGYEWLAKAEEDLQSLSGTDLSAYSNVIGLFDRALQKDVSQNTRARIRRELGEIYLHCGDTTKALEQLEMALRLNAKIGVKKLVEQLKKMKK